MHAHGLSVLLRRAMLGALAAPALACGGALDNGDAGGSDAATSCTAQQTDAGVMTSCGGMNMQLSGDISKCNVVDDAGVVPMSSCQAICGTNYSFCSFDPATNVLTCEGMCVGRLPANLPPAPPKAGRKNSEDATIQDAQNAVGEYLARAAYLEAAAVSAFSILAAELRAHGAPKSLTRSAHRARVDEVRHAREVGALARAFGVAPPKVQLGPVRLRALVDIALENAVEGCVRETFGALVAQWQGEHARDLRVRGAMKRIASDEVRHAALGWRIHDWAMARLSREDQARVRAAMHRAIDELEDSARKGPDAAVARTLGLPNAAEATALVASMRAEVWSVRNAA